MANQADMQDVSDQELNEMVAQADTGARQPTGNVGKALLGVALAWSLFQLWYASPLPFIFNFAVFNDTEARAIHLAFALFLAYTAFPAFNSSPRDAIPITDWVFAVLGAFSAAYIFFFYEELSNRSGAPITVDLVVGICGMLLLLEATRRALGPPLMIVAIVFLVYTFGGQYMPDVIAHKGQSISKVMSHQWLTTEGVFGIALGVSSSFVFLFVLFGAMLEQAGAGNYFIKVAFAGLGHLKGGPAKAAVVASATTGLISGSSIANVATTGTFTIPLMKKVGFSGVKAGAVEVASSTNGQLTPPVMGAAAFLMVEYVGISYIEVIKHAILPALISYIALFYIVHLEALKAKMEGIPKRHITTLAEKLMSFAFIVVLTCIIGLATYYGIGWVKVFAPDAAIYIVSLAVVIAYVGLLKFASKFPVLEMDDPNAPMTELPEMGPTVKSGLHFILPIVILMWCLIVERFSPGLSAFWATVFMIFIVLTQRPISVFFRDSLHPLNIPAWKQGFDECIHGLISGARNMIGIGVATAAAGIIVGTITLTGIGQVMIEFVELISGGNLLLALIFTAMICIILGMGLPTTANYIVVSSLMAPVVVVLGASNGVLIPLIAVHMFVFYFGILADDTPPVGLAAFAAAAIAKSDPIKTGIQGFAYDIRTAILPFMFVFNTQLLLIDVNSTWVLLITIFSATVAMLIFAAATQGYWLVKSRYWETAALLLIAFTLFRPGFWWDRVYPPLQQVSSSQLMTLAEEMPENSKLRMMVTGENIDGKLIKKVVELPLGANVNDGKARLENIGLSLRIEEGKTLIDNVTYSTPAQEMGLDLDWEILHLETETDRPAKQFTFIPALLLLGFIGFLQRRRRQLEA